MHCGFCLFQIFLPIYPAAYTGVGNTHARVWKSCDAFVHLMTDDENKRSPMTNENSFEGVEK